MKRIVILAALACLLPAVARSASPPPAGAGQCPSVGSGTQPGRVQAGFPCTPELNEISGIVWSRRLGNVLWVHEDSGGANAIYAQSPSGGAPLGTITLSGITNQDWEDITIGPGPTQGMDSIYVGDIGDNGAGRSNIKIYFFDEPSSTGNQTVSAISKMTLTYPDGPRDAETLMMDPVTGDLFIIQKKGGGGSPTSTTNVYRKAWPHSPGTYVLEKLGSITISSLIASGDISRDGTGILLKSPNSGGDNHPDVINYFPRSPGQSVWEALQGTPCSLPYTSEGQGESVTFGYPSGGGCNYATISEGGGTLCVGQPINTFPVNDCAAGPYPDYPGSASPTPEPTATPTPAPTPSPTSPTSSSGCATSMPTTSSSARAGA